MAANKRTKAELTRLKKKAKKLFLEHKMTQKEIAGQIGISEKSMGAWVREGGWKRLVDDRDDAYIELAGFTEYLMGLDIALAKTVLGHAYGYLKTQSLRVKITTGGYGR